MLPGITHSQFSSRIDPADIAQIVPLENAQALISEAIVSCVRIDFSFLDSNACTTVFCKPVVTHIDPDLQQYMNQKDVETRAILEPRFKLMLGEQNLCSDSQVIGNSF